MFVKSIQLAQKTMFPIFRFEKLPKNQTNIGVVGTGFFINPKGYFITVAHVFDTSNQNTSYKFWGHLPDKIHNPNIEIVEIARDDNHDIVVGKIALDNTDFSCLDTNIPLIGHSVCISGYPMSQISPNNQGGLELGGVRRYFQPSFVLDRVAIDIDNGKGLKRKHEGFLVRDVGLFGMSGGPIFDIEGRVVGMQASVTDPRVSSNGARTITVENAIAIQSSLIEDLLKKNGIKYYKTKS